jgi:hypothetical protein
MLSRVRGRQGVRQLVHQPRSPMSSARRLRLQHQAVKTAFYAVDRLERNIAVLVSDTGQTIDLPRLELPDGLHEGSVLRVRFGAQNQPDWSSAVMDKEEEERRLKEAKNLLDEMKRSDRGGDITL